MTVVVRPESITVGVDGQFEGDVVMSTFMGAHQEYFVQLGDVTLDVEQLNPAGSVKFKEGEKVRVHMNEESMYIVG